MIDMSVLEKRTHELTWSYDYNHHQFLYRKYIPYEEYNTAYEDSYNTKNYFTIDIDYALTTLKITPITLPDANLHKRIKKIHSIQFDTSLTGGKTKTIYNIDILNNKPQQYSLPRLTATSSTRSITITVNYTHFRPLKEPEIILNPIASFAVSHKEKIKRPLDLIPTLNVNTEKYGYEFTYDHDKFRYVLRCGKTYALQLSKTLADILGFDESASVMVHRSVTLEAQTFPLLHRDITALYVYTNIIDPVYIGDVKAPLLLTCPFKRDNEGVNKTMQQEFLNPCYAPLNRSKLQQIDLAVYDDAGALIPFLYGKTKLSLHFRRRKV